MPPTSERFLELLDQMREMHEKKNAGYAGTDTDDPYKNFRYSSLFGVSPFVGCLIRMSDKFIRISNLCKDPDADKVGESIKDTLLDMSVYCVIAICLYEEEEDEDEKKFMSKMFESTIRGFNSKEDISDVQQRVEEIINSANKKN